MPQQYRPLPDHQWHFRQILPTPLIPELELVLIQEPALVLTPELEPELIQELAQVLNSTKKNKPKSKESIASSGSALFTIDPDQV